jgi:hypothetical protein
MQGDVPLSAADIARLEERLVALHNDVSHIRSKIDGNGSPGLITRVTVLETQSRQRTTALGALAVLGAAAVGGLSSIAVALLG